MDIKVLLEPVEIESQIKDEGELIIEDEWTPTKFRTEVPDGDILYGTVRNSIDNEQFTIEIEICDTDIESTLEHLDTKKYVDREGLPQLKIVNGIELNEWIDDNFIWRECPICNERFGNYNLWRRHFSIHKELVEDSESNYCFRSEGCGTCKMCNQEITTKFSRFIHSATHSEDSGKLNILLTICKICFYNSDPATVRAHILEKHPELLKDFKALGSRSILKCPLCSNTYTTPSHLLYHFMDIHSLECNAKLRYNCHLCKIVTCSEENVFLQHLIERHELNSWNILSYRKIFKEKDIFACIKCNKLFFNNDNFKLLRHFLNHDNKFRWSCRFCGKHFSFEILSFNHMCYKMILYYEKHGKKINVEKRVEFPCKIKWKSKNLQQFQDYIAHICPFCDKNFVKMIKWQVHLRRDHKIETHKALQMKVIEKDNTTLVCTICQSVVANSPLQLHEHCFKHLPHQPYKCLMCSKPLNNFKVAVNHFLKRCRDQDVSVSSTAQSVLQMQCPFCKDEKLNNYENVLKHYEKEHNCFDEFFNKHLDKSMICKICHKNCNVSSTLLHFQNHFDENAFKCKLCLQSYTTYTNFQNHFEFFHQITPVIKSTNIKETSKTTDKISVFINKELYKTSNRAYVLNQYTEFVKYACPECNEVMPSKQNWQTHIETKHHFFRESNLCAKQGDGFFRCLTCKFSSSKLSQQRKHKLIHMPYKSHICNLCYMRFTQLNAIYKHFRQKHFAHGSFQCPICHAVLHTEHERKIHLKEIHPKIDWPDIVCLVCFTVLSSKHALNNHFVTYHGDLANKSISQRNVSNKFEKFINFACPECNERMVTQRIWQTHIQTKHNFFDQSKLCTKQANGSFKCLTCKYSSSKLSQQRKHKLIHMPYKSHICNLCYMRFAQLSKLYNHLRLKHFLKGTYKCPICSEVLHTEHERKVHLKEKHPRNYWPNNVCLICVTLLEDATALSVHMDMHDADVLEYTCDFCGAKIAQSKSFAQHIQQHRITEEKQNNMKSAKKRKYNKR